MLSLKTASRSANDHAAKKVNNSAAKRSRKAARSTAADDNGRDENIRQAAYAFYEARGRVDGYALEDWLQAETQVNQGTAGLASFVDRPGNDGAGADMPPYLREK